MSPWHIGVRSLLREPPLQPDFLKGGRGVISFAARVAAAEAHKRSALETQFKVLRLLDDAGWWKVNQIAEGVGRDKAYLTRVLKQMSSDGLLEGVQSKSERREWKFRITADAQLRI